MGIVKNFIDELSKHKLLVYFVTLWGASLFIWTVYGMVEYGFEMRTSIEFYVVDLLFHFSELFAGLLLLIFGLKLMNTNLLKSIKNERLLCYFLILWAASFFLMGLWYILDFGPAIFENIQNPIAFLGALAKLATGAVLGLFSWKLLNETD
jgi:hypothetical protein